MTRYARFYLLFLLCWFPALAQIAGQNVNMVSGTAWPNGDPFLQRQNEPSLAVSSRNPQHLLAGANDYRTVDLPGLPVGETGDAWLGIFKSYDGGQTWISTVHPGCPQNLAPCSGAPALKGFSAAADPVVRPGANGMFFYSGIAFTRAAKSNSVVFVSRFLDNNNEENGDPIKYIDSTVVTTAQPGTLVDKPWLAVDVPRTGAGSCTINAPQAAGAPISQTFSTGNLYVAYTTFVNEDLPPSQVMFTRSQDCGVTWSNPMGISDTTVNQGASIAIDPVSGAVYVAWRRFQNGTLGDAILLVKSTDGGKTFSPAVQVAAINTFDQATSAFSFRTNDYPTMTVDGAGRVYVAWSERNAGQAASGGDARVVLTTSDDGRNWTPRTPVNDFPGRGHQFMPSITFGGGKVMVVFYDLREDSTVGNFNPIGGGQYAESRVPAGDLATNPPHPEKVFTPFVLDAAPANLMEGGLLRRHTVDVWGALANAGDAPNFSTTRVSQYEFGSPSGSSAIEQLQVDPPNFPLFSEGTEPFFGDYLDVVAAPTIVPGAQAGTWKFATDPSSGVEFHAVWTDNRDVRPPADGNWANYTPPVSVSVTGTSIFDPTQPQPICVTGQTGMRNQNIYTAAVTQGLVVTSPSNTKTLGTLQRAFPVVVQNTTNIIRSYRLTIANQPPGGTASFLEYPAAGLPDPLTVLDISPGPASSASRMVFVTSSNPAAAVLVAVAEISAPGAPTVLPGGQAGSLVLNPDPLNPTNPVTSTNDIFNPAIANPAIANPAIANPDIANPAIANPAIANPAIANPDIANLGVANPDIANPAIANPAIANPDIANPDIANAAITDATWPLSNNGNTAGSYSLHFILDKAIPPNVTVQLIITVVYSTPVANGCKLMVQTQTVVLVNTSNPELVLQQALSQTALGQMLANIVRRRRMLRRHEPTPTFTDVTDDSTGGAIVTMGPGETVYVTLRFFNSDKSKPLGFNPGTDINTIGISQSTNTGESEPSIASSKLFAASGSLPPASSGAAYDATLLASGGTAPYTWTLTSGALPPGLSLSSGGEISGTVSGGSGTYSFTVQVKDSSSPPATVSETLTIQVTGVALTVTGATASVSGGTSAKAGDTITVTASVTNSGSLATGVTPLISLVPTGSAAATCGAPNPSSADLPTGASQTFSFQCTNAGGVGMLAFSVVFSGTDAVANISVNSSPVTSNGVTVTGVAPTFSASAVAGNVPYTSGSWTNQNVTVTFTCTPASGSPTIKTVTLTSEGGSQTATTTCTDAAGNSTTASFSGVNIDRTPPIITASAKSNNAPYAGALTNQAVVVIFACTDALSGVATVTSPQTFATTALNQSATGTCTDKAGNSASATFGPINIVIGSPQLTAVMTAGGIPYTAGAWSNQPVTVTFHCLPAGGLAPVSVTPATVVGQGANQTVSGSCTDQAGNQAQVTAGPINVDTSQPVLMQTSITPSTGAWYRTPVTIVWQCTDRVDGTNRTTSKTVSTEGANQTVTASCTNLAGTTVTASQTGINIDLTPPVVTASPSSLPNGNGWHASAVTVSFTCKDALSGVASAPPQQTFSAEVKGATANGTCTDIAGNSATATYGPINIDRTLPVIAFQQITPAPNGAGWNNSPVTVTWSCSDALSGPVSPMVTQTVATEGANQSATATCTDLAGNTASKTQTGINIDVTPPQIQFVSPANGFSYLHDIKIAASYTCSDGLSGVATCSGTVANGTSMTLGSIGTFSFTVTATDRAGNQTVVTHNYSVH